MRCPRMLVTLVVAALVSTAIGVDLAVRRAKLTKERLGLLVCGYAPLLASVFVSGGVLSGPEAIIPLGAVLGAGVGHVLAQCGSARAGLLLECTSVLAVAITAVVFIGDEDAARAVLVLCAVSMGELGFVASHDFKRL